MINENLLNTLLEFHKPEDKEIIRHQSSIMEKLIEDNIIKYNSSEDYRKGIDDVLILILQGYFIKEK